MQASLAAVATKRDPDFERVSGGWLEALDFVNANETQVRCISGLNPARTHSVANRNELALPGTLGGRAAERLYSRHACPPDRGGLEEAAGVDERDILGEQARGE